MECNRSHNWKEWRGGGKLSYLLMMNWISEERCRWCAMLRIRCAAGYRNWFLPEIIGVRPWAIGFAQFELPIYFFSVWLCCDNLIIVVPRRREDSTLFKENFQTLLRGGQVKKNAFRWWWSWRRIFTPLGAFLGKKEASLKCTSNVYLERLLYCVSCGLFLREY